MNIYELIGLIIGDGHISYKNKSWYLELDGDIKDDRDYFQKIANFLFKITKRNPIIKIRKRKKGYSLELRFNNKKFVEYLIKKLNLKFGNKIFTVKIPEKFVDWRYSKDILKGIFESDGSLYFSKSKAIKYPSYPRIEIKTSSKKLAKQIFEILKNREFKININKTKYKDYKVYISGEEMLKKWIKEIGFSNLATITKYRLWKKLGYYIPRITFEKRKKLLKIK